ncbi:tripartite tricarboxylate transporter permease [Ornithinimicrobium cavernae]|uniref:tripartite tricarboxylate transporter permease n=1 Tax=Ornithinimicrobium cavernae TaxID=2666047 RepID=UPI000D68714C|nr:tripartite tricarboxylate transporter permease [Ornithinimicrobium cavernae]
MTDAFAFVATELLTVDVLLAIFFGSFVGMLIGALPGLGAVLAMVLMLPLTFTMDPMAGILLLLATYQGAEYGGSISAVVLGIPGTPAALVTVFDGAAMAREGNPGKALGYSLVASTVGGLVSGLLLLGLSVPIVQFALLLGDPEFFLIALIGLLAVGSLSSEDVVKSFIAVVLGLMAGTVGLDTITGEARFTLGRAELMEGLGLVALMAGMFGVAELLSLVSKKASGQAYVTSRKGLRTSLTWREIRSVGRSITLGSGIGSLVGVIPGMGAGPSSWFAYSAAKKWSKSPQTFGKGNPDGIAAPEAANNATVGGAMIPLLSLGIPGSPSVAIIMGAFIIHGLQPGPGLFEAEPTLVYGIIYGFLLTSVAMFIVGKLLTTGFARILTVSNAYLIPLVMVSIIVGTFASRYLFFDLWIALAAGVVTALAVKLRYSVAAFILAFILGPIAEVSLRRTLVLSDGSFSVFLTRPLSLALVILIAVILALIAYSVIRRATKPRAEVDVMTTV